MVEYEDSFNIIGGSTGSFGNSDKIYNYNKAGGQWVELPTTLSEGKRVLTAIKVKSSFFRSC